LSPNKKKSLEGVDKPVPNIPNEREKSRI